jgi:hypothetical protein
MGAEGWLLEGGARRRPGDVCGNRTHLAGRKLRFGSRGSGEALLEIAMLALGRAGASDRHVVRTRMYITNAKHSDAVGRAHHAFFGGVRPAATMVVVAGLLDKRWKVEVEVEAVIDD